MLFFIRDEFSFYSGSFSRYIDLQHCGSSGTVTDSRDIREKRQFSCDFVTMEILLTID